MNIVAIRIIKTSIEAFSNGKRAHWWSSYVIYPVVQVDKKFSPNRIISFQRESSRSGDAYRHHQLSERLATVNPPNWATVHEIIKAIVAGKISRGGLRNALLAIVVKAAAVSPARESFKGFKAHT
jgi:hypothetical protein